MSALGYSLVTVAVTALLALMADRFQARRAAVADALVSALTDAQRPRFLLDLASDTHASFVTGPLNEWVALLRSVTPAVDPSGEQLQKKVDEILDWRMSERRERIRFAAVGRAREIRHLAEYYRVTNKVTKKSDGTAGAGEAVDTVTNELVSAIAAVRVPSLLRPVHWFVEQVPFVNKLLVSTEDLRMLTADYSLIAPDGSR